MPKTQPPGPVTAPAERTPWIIERGQSPTVTIIRRPARATVGWSDHALFISDLHWDNPQCDRALLRRHLDQALEIDAPVFVFGDFYCAMQGRYDKRSDKSSIRPEHQNGRYLDSLVETAADWFAPYVDVLAFVSPGNHESKIRKHEETDLLQRFAALYNARGGRVAVGTYAGWVLYRHEVRFGKANRQTYTTTVAYHHGHGGGGPVTRGVIQTNRRGVYLPDADILVTGHIHEAWQVETPRARVTNQGRAYLDTQTHLQLGTYKEEYAAGEGWHIERGAPPKPMGGWWVRFHAVTNRADGNRTHAIRYQALRTDRP